MKLTQRLAAVVAMGLLTMSPVALVITAGHAQNAVATDGVIVSQDGVPLTVNTDGTIIVENGVPFTVNTDGTIIVED